MTSLFVGGFTFTFPTAWCANKYDEWAFYRRQFGTMRDGIKAVDILVLEPGGIAWFVEVKDYRIRERKKPSEVSDEVAQKVFDTLAALLPAQANANDSSERQMASALLRATRLRVVLHIEQPTKHSRLQPRAIDLADVKQKLRRLLKPIDPHPVVTERNRMGSVPWSVV